MDAVLRYFLAFWALLFNSELTRCQEHCKVIADCDGQVEWKKWLSPVRPSPPGNTIQPEDQDKPKRHFYTSTLTWASGKAFCASVGGRICRSTELCSERDGARNFHFDVVPGDHWVPVLDSQNEWVEIGDSHRRTCFKHGPHYGPPAWGTTTVIKPYKGYVYCCPSDTENFGNGMRYQYIGNKATYASSRRHCEKQDMRLCSSVEVCRNFAPAFGVISGDMWVAVNDRENEWIEVGDSGGRTCYMHGVRYGAPPWGIRTDGSNVDHVGYVYCCS